jgi:hypothetical protein
VNVLPPQDHDHGGNYEQCQHARKDDIDDVFCIHRSSELERIFMDILGHSIEPAGFFISGRR